MPQLNIHRDHALGLDEARKVAWAWAEQAEQQFGMDCTVIEGDLSDTVEFSRSGVKGQLVVAADHFDLQAQLGFLLGAFSKTIEAEIERNLDALLGQGTGTGAGAGQAKPTKTAKAGKSSKAATAPDTAANAPEPAKAAAKSSRKRSG